MAKASKQQAAEHHKDILAAASHLFRRKGMQATSVPEVMQAAGMTHGGFYGHFKSKDALAAAATSEAFDWLDELLTRAEQRHPGDGPAAFSDIVDTYLLPFHRDNPGDGCPVAGLATDVGREPERSAVRATYVAGLEAAISRLAGESAMEPDRTTALVDYATLVGTILLARATAGSALSDDFLEAARQALVGRGTRPAAD